ncbi:hypothetical protein CEXT_248821 [Caerostris extrusa]|uniref:Uncharacterized protein n=1 Tax=Caerostris extrusa TaxID=172846 RepID=A0AAV4TH53_CAEEX|nr:hypothetical protein CEXT_248821 [Caerostris extrusa]
MTDETSQQHKYKKKAKSLGNLALKQKTFTGHNKNDHNLNAWSCCCSNAAGNTETINLYAISNGCTAVTHVPLPRGHAQLEDRKDFDRKSKNSGKGRRSKKFGDPSVGKMTPSDTERMKTSCSEKESPSDNKRRLIRSRFARPGREAVSHSPIVSPVRRDPPLMGIAFQPAVLGV